MALTVSVGCNTGSYPLLLVHRLIFRHPFLFLSCAKKKEVGKWNKTNGNTAKETVAEGKKK